MDTTPQQPVITRISVARLHQDTHGHRSFELTADVPPGKAAQTLIALTEILEDLRPVQIPRCHEYFTELLVKSEDATLNKQEMEFLRQNKEVMDNYEALADQQHRAIERLDALCGIKVVKDANDPSF